MRRRLKLIRKTLVHLHRRRGTSSLTLPSDLAYSAITRFRLLGEGCLEADGTLGGVGDLNTESGEYYLPIAMRGRNLMSGRDFASIHITKKDVMGSAKPSINDTYYFCGVNTNGNGTVILDNSNFHFKENTAYTFTFTITYLNTARPRYPNLCVNYTDGTSYIPSYDTNTTTLTEIFSTDPSKTIAAITSFVYSNSTLRMTLADFGIFEGVYNSFSEAFEPYIGTTVNIMLTAPLRSVGYSRDERDLKTGELKRKICLTQLNADTDFNWIETDKETFIRAALPSPARIGSRIYLSRENEPVSLSKDGESLDIRIPELIDPSLANDYFSEYPLSVGYVMKDPIYEQTDALGALPAGAYTVAVESSATPKLIYAEFV